MAFAFAPSSTRKFNQRGISIISLVVALSIIGVLATLALPAYQNFMTRSRYEHAKTEISAMQALVVGRRLSENKTLTRLTGNGCTGCDEGWGTTTTDNFTNTTSPSVTAAWKILGYDSNPKDPWGGYYALDENEGELDPDDCRPDQVVSGGPDHLTTTSDTVVAGDDAVIKFPTFNESCAKENYNGGGLNALPPGFYGF